MTHRHVAINLIYIKSVNTKKKDILGCKKEVAHVGRLKEGKKDVPPDSFLNLFVSPSFGTNVVVLHTCLNVTYLLSPSGFLLLTNLHYLCIFIR